MALCFELYTSIIIPSIKSNDIHELLASRLRRGQRHLVSLRLLESLQGTWI